MPSWMIWGVKAVASWIGTAVVAYVVSFNVADYISDKHMKGMTVAVNGLQQSVSDLSGSVSAVNEVLSAQLNELRRARAELAVTIAKELQGLQGDKYVHAKDIELMQKRLVSIEARILEISANLRINYTVDGGKSFKTFDASAENLAGILKDFEKIPQNEDAFVIAPYSVIRSPTPK